MLDVIFVAKVWDDLQPVRRVSQAGESQARPGLRTADAERLIEASDSCEIAGQQPEFRIGLERGRSWGQSAQISSESAIHSPVLRSNFVRLSRNWKSYVMFVRIWNIPSFHPIVVTQCCDTWGQEIVTLRETGNTLGHHGMESGCQQRGVSKGHKPSGQECMSPRYFYSTKN